MEPSRFQTILFRQRLRNRLALKSYLPTPSNICADGESKVGVLYSLFGSIIIKVKGLGVFTTIFTI